MPSFRGFLEAIASLGLTFSLGHSVSQSVTRSVTILQFLQFLQERWLTTYFQVVNYLENSMICKYIPRKPRKKENQENQEMKNKEVILISVVS